MANTAFVGGRSPARMGFFHGEIAKFLGSNARLGLEPSLVRLSWGGQEQAGRNAAADRCMSVLLHTARPAVQHLLPAGAALLAPKAPRVCGNGALGTM